MAHLIRKYNPPNTSEPVSLGAPPLSVDSVSAAWYGNSLPSSKPGDSKTSYNGRVLTGTDVISAKLLESLRSMDPYAARKPPKGTLADEYSKYASTSTYPKSKTTDLPKSSSFGAKTVTFSTPPNSDMYGSGSNSSKRFPQVKQESSAHVNSSFPSRSNEVHAPYKTSELPSNPSQASRTYSSTYNTSYGTVSRDPYKSRDDTDRSREDRMRRNSLAMRSRENSMFNIQPREPTFGTDEYYMRKIAEIINQPTSALFPSSPSQITDFMYVGGYRDAENWMYLKRLGITHVLNTAAMRRSTYNPYPPESGIVGYESFDADDAENYDVMQHFPRAKAFIDRCKWSGGKVLVHCAMGVNRSGTMCCAYLMADQKMPLLEAMKRMKQRRYTTLCNRGFQRQLLRYARQKGHL